MKMKREEVVVAKLRLELVNNGAAMDVHMDCEPVNWSGLESGFLLPCFRHRQLVCWLLCRWSCSWRWVGCGIYDSIGWGTVEPRPHTLEPTMVFVLHCLVTFCLLFLFCSCIFLF